MGIQNYLKRVSKATKDIKSAIAEKGVAVSSCDGIEVLADKVRAIEVGSSVDANEVLYTMLAFRQSASMPGTPVGGSFTETRINYPSGWSDGAGFTENVWMSYCIVRANGSIVKDWVTPIKLSGGSSVDLTDYALKSWVIDQIATGGSIDLSKCVSSLNSMTGNVTLMGSESVSIERGSDGKSLIFTAKGGGGGGNDGDTVRSFNIYKNTDSNVDIPDIPSPSSRLPYWDYNSGELVNCPSGWSTDMTSEPTKYTWMAVAFFSKNSAGAMVGTWEGPFCITGEPGQPGKDGANFEFIYALTPDADKRPNYPTSAADRKALFDAVEQGDSSSAYHVYNGQKWYDRAQSIDSTTNRACWMAQRVKYAGASDWAFYSEPVIWANWGSDGTDGDGVEYIFFLTDDAHQNSGKWYSDAPDFNISYTNPGTVNGVSTAYADNIDDWVPQGWTDEPQDVSESEGFYEFCSVRKSKNGIWEKFSTPALWAKFAMDGKDGASIEYVFALCSDELSPSQVSVDNDAANIAGAHTTDEYLPMFDFNGTKVQSTDDPESVSEEKRYQWVSIRRRKRGANTEWGDFSHPALWNMWSKGSQGPKGEDGDKWEYCYALSESYVVPAVDVDTPSSHSPTDNPSEDGFLPSFVFVHSSQYSTTESTWAEEPAVSSSFPYCWASRRRYVNGTEWGDWQTPYMCRNYVKAGLSDEEIKQLKDEVSSQITGSVIETEKEVEAIKTRLEKIDGTDATFFVDNEEGIISAITNYKDENQKSFSDLVLNGSEGTFDVMVGKYLESEDGKETLAGAGVALGDGFAKMYADYTEVNGEDGNFDIISGLRTDLDSVKGRLELGGDYTTRNYVDEKVTTMAKETLDAAKGLIDSTAAKGTWIWGVWENAEDADPDNSTDPTYIPKGKLLATKPYDLTRFTKYTDADGVEHPTEAERDNFFESDFNSDGTVKKSGEDKYRETIEGTVWEGTAEHPNDDQKLVWTRTIEAKAFSKILQTAGEIDLTAYGEDKSLARIVLSAKKYGSDISFEADAFTFTAGSVINADNLIIRNLVVTGAPDGNDAFEYDPRKDDADSPSFGANIRYANIDKCKITSCRITSAIQSSNYDAHDDTTSPKKAGVGFMLDGAGGSYALYSQNGGRVTNEQVVADTVRSTNYSSENKTGFQLDGDGTYALYGGSGENAFRLTNEEIVIPAALIKGVTATSLVSDNFQTEDRTDETITTHGEGFKLDSTDNTFEFYKPKDGGGYEFKLTNDELVIDSAHITNLTAGNIEDFEIAVQNSIWKQEGTVASLIDGINELNASGAELKVQSLVTTDSDDYMLNVGKDANISTGSSLKYIDAFATDEIHFNSKDVWSQAFYTDTVLIEEGQSLVIPPIWARSWGWNAYATNCAQKLVVYLQKGVVNYKTVGSFNESRNKDGAITTTFKTEWVKYDNLPAGAYRIYFDVDFEHPGNNLQGWSKLKFSYDPFTFEVRTPRNDKPGMYINTKQFVMSSWADNTAEKIGEVSLSYDKSSGVSSKGIVLSPTIEKIQVVNDNSSVGASDNVLYIYLA